MEPTEAGLAIERGFLTDFTTVITTTERVYSTAEKVSAGDGRIDVIPVIGAIKKAAKKINKKLKILGVTVLTGFSNQSLKKTGHTRSIKNLVIHQTKLAKSAGLDGIVCSAEETRFVKKICKNMEIVTPGIRLSGDNVQDQNKNRVVNPKSAFNNGATAIVIGRSITQGSIKNNLQKLIKSLN